MSRNSYLKNRKLIIAVAVCICLFFSIYLFDFIRSSNNFYATADFEPLETVYMVWKDQDSAIIARISSEISKYESVTLFIDDVRDDEQRIKKLIEQHKGNTQNIGFKKMTGKPDNNWVRDYAPVFLKNRNDLKMLKLYYWDPGADISEALSKAYHLPLIESPLYSMGGTREFNGKGTGIFVEAHEKLANPGLFANRAKFDRMLKKQFKLKKIIWLKK